jgi:hypothetical protein
VGELRHAALIGVEIEPGTAIVAPHAHRVHRRDAPRIRPWPGAEPFEKSGVARADGVDARVPAVVLRRFCRRAALDERDLQPGSRERCGKRRAHQPAADDDHVVGRVHARAP